MRLLTSMLAGLAITAASAMALDKEFVDKMTESARNVERDAMGLGTALKSKSLDAAAVKVKIGAMSADLPELQVLVDQYEAAHPTFSGRDAADWKLVKEKVQLLEIFHARKKQLAEKDLSKNRGLIRAHADGVAKRARMLQQTLTRLERSPLS